MVEDAEKIKQWQPKTMEDAMTREVDAAKTLEGDDQEKVAGSVVVVKW